MGTYEELKAAIQQVIRTNGNNGITGALLQNALLSIVNVVGANATFAGIATPNTNPGTADQNVFYLATEAGTYVNFGGIEINMGEAVILSNKTGNWVKTTSGFATQQHFKKLDLLVAKNGYGFDRTVEFSLANNSISFDEYIQVKKGDKLFVEFKSVEMEAMTEGAISIVPYTVEKGQDTRYVLRYEYMGELPLNVVWEFVEDATIKAFDIIKNANVTSYSGILRIAGNNYAEFYQTKQQQQQQINANKQDITINHTLLAANGYGFDNTVVVGTNISSNFQFPQSAWLSLKKGDKLFVELKNVEMEVTGNGAIVATLWTSTGNAEKYQLRCDYDKDNINAIWELEEDLIVRGINILKNAQVISYKATLRFAGNNVADIFFNRNKLNEHATELINLDTFAATNGYGFDKTFRLQYGVKSSYDFPNNCISLKKGDKLFVEFKSVEMEVTGNGAIVATLRTLTGNDERYTLRYDYNKTLPIYAIWEMQDDIDVRGISVIKNAQVISYNAEIRFAGHNVAKLYEQGKLISQNEENVNIIVAQRNNDDFNSIREIIDNLNASADNQYLIYVPKGRWFECDLVGKPYVKIVGEDMHETILYCDGLSQNTTPADYSFVDSANLPLSDVNRSHKHCVNVKNDIYMENLTIEANNCKYCVHLDASGKRKGIFKNCRFVAKQTMNYPLGFGVWGNQEFQFDGCEIIQSPDGNNYCMYIHNWNNQKAISKVVFDRCLFNKSYVTIGELGSEYSCLLDFKNCVSEFSEPTINIYVEMLDGKTYWRDENGNAVTDPLLVPYSIKINYVGTNLYGFKQQGRPNILSNVIGENKAIV